MRAALPLLRIASDSPGTDARQAQRPALFGINAASSGKVPTGLPQASPASIVNVWPDTPEARSDDRNKMPWAISAGDRDRRPSAGESKCAGPLPKVATRGERTLPGATALTRMPYGAHSTAIVSVRAMIPAFAAP